MKYSFKEKESGLLIITLSMDGKSAVLDIQDDGNELPENFDVRESKGFGLVLVKMLTEQLKGEFKIENNNGTHSVVKFMV